MPRTSARLALAALTAVAVLGCAATAAADGLRAYQVVYRTAFKGIGAGDLQLTLKPDAQPDSWVYETRAFPSLLASFVVDPGSRERSWFHVAATGIVPDRYFLDDGRSDRHDDIELAYDWTAGRVSGSFHARPLELALPPGTQDVMTIRAAPSVDLLAGREPHEYTLLDNDEVKSYLYRRVGPARLKTALGELDTVVFDSVRKGSDGHGRSWRYWYAPALDWLAVRIEQRDDGATRLSFAVRSLKWLPGPAAATAPP